METTKMSYWPFLMSIKTCLVKRLVKHFYLRPQRFRNINSWAGRALLPLVFEGRSDGAGNHRVHVSWRVNKMIIFSATFSDQTREPGVGAQVVADGLPEPLERSEKQIQWGLAYRTLECQTHWIPNVLRFGFPMHWFWYGRSKQFDLLYIAA